MTVPTRFVTQARRFVILRLPGTNASVLIRWIPRSERKILFTQPIFLFLFLPLLLGTYFSVPWRMRNPVLLGFSLVFYTWGEPRYLPLLVGMVGVDYVMAMSIDREITRSEGRGSWKANLLLGFAISANLGLLLIFKYTDFAVDNLNVVVKCIGTLFPGMRFYGFAEPRIALPLGISFFTFHAISYVVDVHGRRTRAATNPLDLMLYVVNFPQLIAGPIVRYVDVAEQIHRRTCSSRRFARGTERFLTGLAKKLIIANTMGLVADRIFGLGVGTLATFDAWAGLIAYSLQIYYDFSGYSDMAIGLGAMFGFRFRENFAYPYSARSMRDFWRRWHISLSTFLRDYLYIPLGGNRVPPWRVKLNLVIVFLLCGFWHGANWTFIVWGAIHGAMLMLERGRWGAAVDRMPRWIGNAYVLLVVMLAWVFFRASSLIDGAEYLLSLLGCHDRATEPIKVFEFTDAWVLGVAVVGILLSWPAWPMLRVGAARLRRRSAPFALGVEWCRIALFVSLILICGMRIAGNSYNPFIYFRF